LIYQSLHPQKRGSHALEIQVLFYNYPVLHPFFSFNSINHLAAKTEFFVRYKWTEKDYKGKPILYSQDRKDKQHNMMAVLSQEFLKHFFATFTFSYTDNDSNASLYKFDKTTHTINVGFKF